MTKNADEKKRDEADMEVFEKFKKIVDEQEKSGKIDLFKAFKEVDLKSPCCNAELEKDRWDSIICKKCKEVIIGCLQ